MPAVETAAKTIVAPRQVHGGNIARASWLTPLFRGGDAGAAQPAAEADGVVLDALTVKARISTADCAAVALLGDTLGVLLHVSRKTLIHGLFENAFSYLTPQDVSYVYVGPHICEFHFSFEREAADLKQFRIRFPQAVHFHQQRLHLSLRAALERVFRDHEIHQRRVTWDGRCTFEHEDLPSYRRLLAQGLPVHSLPALWTVVWREASG